MTEEKSLFQPLQVDPEILEELVGSDVEKKVHSRGCFPKFANDKCLFMTTSGHFFGNCINIFYKTEVQTVILRC